MLNSRILIGCAPTWWANRRLVEPKAAAGFCAGHRNRAG